MGRVIKPMEIANQVYSMKSVLVENKNILYSVLIELKNFSGCENLQGQAWGNMKEHMENHETLVGGMICMIEKLITSCNDLVAKCGTEDLDEDVFLEQKNSLISTRTFYEDELNKLMYMDEMTYNVMNSVVKSPYWGDQYTMDQKKLYYSNLIQNINVEIDLVNDIISKIDDIEDNTANLFCEVQELQVVIREGLEYLKASYTDTGYIYPIGWDLSWKAYLKESWVNITGVSNREEPALLTDVEKIEASKTDGKMYFSNDKQTIIYGGEVYKIDVPEMEYDLYYDNVYESVKTMEKNDINFNWAEAITNIELESPDYSPVYAGNTMVYNPSMDSSMAAGIAISGALNFISSGIDRVDIKVVLKNSSDEENNKAIIYLGSYENRNMAQQLNYDYPMSVLDVYSGEKYVQSKLSEAHFNFYNNMTGGNKVQGTKVYDVMAEFNSDRQFAPYDRYISFDAQGNMIVTPMRYEGDRVYIVESEDYFHLEFKEVLDITNYIFSSYIVESSQAEELISSIILENIAEE